MSRRHHKQAKMEKQIEGRRQRKSRGHPSLKLALNQIRLVRGAGRQKCSTTLLVIGLSSNRQVSRQMNGLLPGHRATTHGTVGVRGRGILDTNQRRQEHGRHGKAISLVKRSGDTYHLCPRRKGLAGKAVTSVPTKST